jgi:hypothetical protein
MPLHPITFLWVEQQEYERGMTYQEVERAARLAARRATRSELEFAPLPVSTGGGLRSLMRWFGRVPGALVQLGQRGPTNASSQTGSTGA